MFMILSKPTGIGESLEAEGQYSYTVVPSGSFDHEVDARKAARALAKDAPNTFLVVQVQYKVRRTTTTVEEKVD